MKTIYRLAFLFVILQGCSSSKYVFKEYKNDPSLYYPSSYTFEDIRVYDEYPDIMCQLDKCTLEELTDRLQGHIVFKRSESQIENPLLVTSFQTLLRSAVENIETKDGVNPAVLSMELSCIGFGEYQLQVTVRGEMTCHGTLVWKGTGVGARSFPYDLTFDQIEEEDWNDSISQAIEDAIKDCLKHLPK